MKNIFYIGAAVIIAIFLTAVVIPGLQDDEPSVGGAGTASFLQVATTTTIGPDINIQLFADNGYCRSRVVSTQAQAIMVIFADPTNGNLASTTLTQTAGHIQGASSTVVYSSDDVGCGRAFGYAAASTTITTSEF